MHTDTSERPHRVLLIEDDEAFLSLLEDEFRAEGYEVVPCTNGWDLLSHLAHFLEPEVYTPEYFDLIVSDVYLPGASGMDVLRGLGREGIPPMILMTAFGNHRMYEDARRFGAAALLEKPFEMEDLLETASEILGDVR